MSRCRNWEPLIDRRFFWGGNTEVDKVAWIAWDKALLPRTNGGLGIGSLKPSNQSLLAKWWWRFRNEGTAIWCKVIRSIHGESGGILSPKSHKNLSDTWSEIIKLKDDLSKININLSRIFKKKIGNGQTTSFWHDNWLGGSNLHETFPCLRAIRSQQEYEEMSTLTNLLIGLHLSTNQDTWEFTLGASRTFTVNILTWRVSNKRILTRYNLDRRGIDLHSSRCPVCDNDIETEEHLFVKCPIAIASWKMVFSWWQLVDIPLSNLGDVLTMAERTPMTKAQKKFFDAMVNTTI
ncbi:RNA-directed DNA polymerase, eukaryota, reverse transcriptase zinc-binding domain protein [Tanacetum coccineum]